MGIVFSRDLCSFWMRPKVKVPYGKEGVLKACFAGSYYFSITYGLGPFVERSGGIKIYPLADTESEVWRCTFEV